MKGDIVNRRDFIKWLFGALAGAITILLGWPSISFLLGSSRAAKKGEDFVKVPDFASIPQGVPVKMMFPYTQKDAFLTHNETLDVWVIKRSAVDATVYSPICTHLSCRFDFKNTEGQFVCPCHASVFGPSGKVLAGPAPRPLDVLPHRIENGELFVQWQTFKPGIATKIEA